MNPLSSPIRRITIAAACLLAAALLTPQLCRAKAETKPVNERVLKVIYFIPTNRNPQPGAIEKMKAYVKILQKFYAMEMARNGFYKPGTTEGKTFAYEADEKGDPVVHILKGKYDDAHYKDGPAQFGMVSDEVSAVYPLKKATYLVWTECCVMNPDSTVSGPSCLGAAGEFPGGAGGMAILGSDSLAFLDSKLFTDTRSVEGLILPELGPYPIKHNVSYGGFAGTTVGNYASTIHGAIGHEVGHAFNLPHVFVNDYAPKIGGDLMGRGNQGFRGDFGNFLGEYCHLFKPSCEILAVERVFNPGEPLTDTKPPKQAAEVVLENATLEMGKNIRVRVRASDPDSGLWRTIAIISPPWSTIDSAPFDASGVAELNITPEKAPYEALKPNNYNLELIAGDMQGNWSLTAHWVPVPKSLALECMDGGVWRELPSGCTSPTGSLRLAATIIGVDENTTLIPEVEVQPAGKPFTGKPNFKGTEIAYSKEPVTVYVEMNLPDGSYHWRYRLSTNTGKHSCWVTMWRSDQTVADFRDASAP